jgi:hypothetical protein
MHTLVPYADVVIERRGDNVRKHDKRIEHDHKDDQIKKEFDDMQIGPVEPSHVLGGFTGFDVPNHAQQIFRIKGKHVKGKDVQGQCYEKRANGKAQERKIAETEPNSPDMESPTFRKGPEGFKHT